MSFSSDNESENKDNYENGNCRENFRYRLAITDAICYQSSADDGLASSSSIVVENMNQERIENDIERVHDCVPMPRRLQAAGLDFEHFRSGEFEFDNNDSRHDNAIYSDNKDSYKEYEEDSESTTATIGDSDNKYEYDSEYNGDIDIDDINFHDSYYIAGHGIGGTGGDIGDIGDSCIDSCSAEGAAGAMTCTISVDVSNTSNMNQDICFDGNSIENGGINSIVNFNMNLSVFNQFESKCNAYQQHNRQLLLENEQIRQQVMSQNEAIDQLMIENAQCEMRNLSWKQQCETIEDVYKNHTFVYLEIIKEKIDRIDRLEKQLRKQLQQLSFFLGV